MKSIELTKNEKKSKNIILIITSILTLLIGASFFINGYTKYFDGCQIFYVAMLLYFGLEFTNYLLTKKITGMDSLYKSLAALIASVSGLLYMDKTTNLVVGYTLVGWLVIMLVIKLIKIEDLRNKLNNGVFINIFTMSLFILLGFLVSTNIFMGITNIPLLLGFFFIANGVINIGETISNIWFDK